MNIYIADLSDPFIVSIREMIAADNPTKEELFEQAEPFKDNIVRGEAHHSFGHRWNHTPEEVEKIRQRMTGEGNHMYGTTLPKDHPFKGGYNKGKKFSEDHKEKMRQAKLGLTKSSSHKEAMAEAHRQRLAEKVHCPHCNKYCSKHHWATQKYHFDNCKHNK